MNLEKVKKYNKNTTKKISRVLLLCKILFVFVQNDTHFLVHFLYLLKEKKKKNLQKAYFSYHFKYSFLKSTALCIKLN